MLLIIFLALFCVLLYLYLTHKLNYWKYRNVPCKAPNLLFGNFAALTFTPESPGKYLGRLYNEFKGPYFGFYAFTTPWLIIKDPGLIKRILIKDSHIFPNRSMVCDETIDPMLCNALIGARTPNWKILRTKLSPVFSTGKIKAMLPLMSECGGHLTDYIKTCRDSSIEVKEMAAKYTTDVITSSVFGISENSFVHENNEFSVARKQLFRGSPTKALIALSYIFIPILVKICRFKFIDGGAADFLKKACNDSIRKREDSKIKRNDLIDILIELKNLDTKDDEFRFYGDRLTAQAVIFFVAGHETTSSVIAFTLHELCVSPQIQQRLRTEINDVIQKYGDLTYEAIHDMQYLHMILSETLRKYPLVPFLNRQCEEDYKIPETGLILEKGTSIMIPQHGLHWDPKYFPNPEVFDPERFSQRNKDALANNVYIPFGSGPRNCIGERFGMLSSKVGIIQIIRNFEVIRNADTREPLVFGRAGLLHAVPGVFVTFKQIF